MNATFLQLSLLDRSVAVAVNRLNLRPAWGRLFAIVSRLGDGVFWYTLMAVIPIVHGWEAWSLSLALALNGGLCTVMYKLLKESTQRPRPCDAVSDVHRTVAPLDRFSFPSGHTLHAVSFTLLTVMVHAEWGAILIPFATLVAVSRLVLGLHWPSDVLAGAAIGSVSALSTWYVGREALAIW
jgi:undecaprenyl-diphosphatase